MEIQVKPIAVFRRPNGLATRTRRVVTNQRCVLCGQFHTHRMQVPTYVRPPAVLYAVCHETDKIITVNVPETAL